MRIANHGKHQTPNQSLIILSNIAVFTFKKQERLTSLKEIDALFERRHSSGLSIYPLRTVYRTFTITDEREPAIKVLVSVAKKRLHHAVDRNRAKRQIREAYRLQHQALSETLRAKGLRMNIAFVWLSNEPVNTQRIFEAMQNTLTSIEQRIAATEKHSADK